MNAVVIVDYGMCNLDSISRAISECGGSPTVTNNPADLKGADRIILPGVGAFPDAMDNLKKHSLDDALGEQILNHKVPFLGICLGMQLMAETGLEGGETPGLGWIKGAVKRFEPDSPQTRIPHMGWNEVDAKTDHPLFKDIDPGKDFYFVHSYHLDCQNPNDILATTPYCTGFASAVGRDNLFGVQFHAEKSQRVGFQLLANFLAL